MKTYYIGRFLSVLFASAIVLNFLALFTNMSKFLSTGNFMYYILSIVTGMVIVLLFYVYNVNVISTVKLVGKEFRLKMLEKMLSLMSTKQKKRRVQKFKSK